MKSPIRSLLIICLWMHPSYDMDAKKSNDFVLCTWNIGHFSNGSKHFSMIGVEEYKKQLELYRSFIYSEVCPDIITVNEYNHVFCGNDTKNKTYHTSLLLFNHFRYKKIGSQYTGICNAVFSNVKIRRSHFVFFESHKKTVGDDNIKTRENYYIESDLYIGGKKVKLVCLHLLFSSRIAEKYQMNQMEELINHYSDTERVILCGDWNTGIYSSLTNAGYLLANDGSLKTFPSKGYALDNIAVKGLDISDIRMVRTELSDHYPLMCRISLK